jgi:hypothetical protein
MDVKADCSDLLLFYVKTRRRFLFSAYMSHSTERDSPSVNLSGISKCARFTDRDSNPSSPSRFLQPL